MPTAKVIATRTAQTDDLETFKNLGKNLSTKYGPAFKKLFDKTLNNAKPFDTEKQPLQQNIADPTAFNGYAMLIDSVKDISKLGKASQTLLSKLYSKHLEIKKEFDRVKLLDQELKPFINFEHKTIFINADSESLIKELTKSHENINELSDEIKQIIEEGFDNITSLGI